MAALCRGGGCRRLAGAGARRRAGQRDGARRRPGAGAHGSCARAAARPPRSRWPSPARPWPTTRPGWRRCATRSGPSGRGPRGRQRRVGRRRGGARDRAAGPGGRRAGVRRAAVRDGRGPRRGTPRGRRSRSPPTSRSGGPRTPTGCATSRPPTSRCSRCSRSAGCAPACGSPRRSGCRSWCRARWRPRSGSRPASRWRRRCRTLPYACGLATVQLLTDDVVGEPLLPVDGVLPVGCRDRRPARPRPARCDRRPGGALGGPAGARCGRCERHATVARSVDRRAGRGRRRARGAGARVAQRTARVRGVRRRRGGPAPAAHPDRRAHRRLPGARAGQGRPPGRGDVHVGHRGGQPAPGRARGRARRRAAGRGHRRPAGVAARHRRQPDHRPGRASSARWSRRVDVDAPSVRWPVGDRAGAPQRAVRRAAGARRTDGCRRLAPAGDRSTSGSQRSVPAAPSLGPRTVVVAGDDAGPSPRASSRRGGGWPLLAEPSSGARTGATRSAPTGCCCDASSAEQVERVVVFGHPTLSRPVHAAAVA